MASDVVWWPASPGASRGSVTALIVSYNTRELTAFLLWWLRTIVSWPELEIVVVDNGSRDGSVPLLAEAERAGVCTLLANHDNRQHGPGLNQGISYLASRPGPRPAWIWILDSDVVAARPDALSAAISTAQEHSAALIGEPQHDQWHPDGRFGQYSLLMDPAVVWPQAGPFADGGDPSLDLLTSAARLGIPMAPFPFTAAGHVIHRGRGSLAAVYAAGDRSHPLYEWAAGHHAPHFAEVPGADQRYHALLQEFRTQTGQLTGTTLAAVCRRASSARLPRTRRGRSQIGLAAEGSVTSLGRCAGCAFRCRETGSAELGDEEIHAIGAVMRPQPVVSAERGQSV